MDSNGSKPSFVQTLEDVLNELNSGLQNILRNGSISLRFLTKITERVVSCVQKEGSENRKKRRELLKITPLIAKQYDIIKNRAGKYEKTRNQNSTSKNIFGTDQKLRY